MKKLEVCCYSIEDAVKAQAAGADRIELCSGRADGGLTPSYGELKQALTCLSIPVHPIIRPRGGDFYYSQSELRSIEYDIKLVKDLGFKGVVFGLLNQYGELDIQTMEKLMNIATGLSVTFHRAFDVCKSPIDTLVQLAELGVDRVLTSGQQMTAEQGLPLLIELNALSDRPIIMPGCGIRLNNFDLFVQAGFTEIHTSASATVPSPMQYRHPNVSMSSLPQDEYLRYSIDSQSVVEMKKRLQG